MKILNSHVVDLLNSELRFVIEDAQIMAENLDIDQMEPLQEAIKQIRGTCEIAELDSLQRVSEEMLISIEAAIADQVDREELKTLLSSSLKATTKLASAIVEAKKENACVLLPEMTALRRLRGETPLYEYHCLNNIKWPAFDKQVASNPLAGEQKEDVRRLLHLFQFGLLDIIRDNNRNKAFVILFRVAQRLQNIAILTSEKDYWWLIGLVVRAFAEDKLELQVERVRLLVAVEKQLRLLATDTPGEGRNPYPEGLWRAFLSLTALIDAKDDDERERRARTEIPELDFSEEDISAIRKSIVEATEDDGREAFESLKELISSAQSLIDKTQDESAYSELSITLELQKTFETMGALWEQTGFYGLSRRFKQFSARLQSSRPDTELPLEMIVEFIDANLQAECALIEFDYVPPLKMDAKTWEKKPLTELLQTSLLKTAQLAVMEESGLHLDEVKEMLDNVASGYAGDEVLPELESALQIIGGSVHIMRLSRLEELLSRCLGFVKNRLFSDQVDQLVENYWDIFADSIACLDYYIDNCKSGNHHDEAALDLANECLMSLGV